MGEHCEQKQIAIVLRRKLVAKWRKEKSWLEGKIEHD